MKGYGSTNDPPPVGNGNVATPAPAQQRTSLPRNESAGAGTAVTTETEPLLGEQLLLGDDDTGGGTATGAGGIDPKWLSYSGDAGDADADASTIERIGSDQEDTLTSATPRSRTPRRSGSPFKKIHRPDSDPHIGINVITNELDTLAYSRDVDESTLFSNDNFTKKYLLSVNEAGKKRGLLERLFSQDADGADPPYMLVCLGLAVGIGICSVAALVYVEYGHHTVVSNENITTTSSSSEGTWHGVPYTKIGRESFGDSISNIFDISLFHPSLLYGGQFPKEGKKTGASVPDASKQQKQQHAVMDDDEGGGSRKRKLAGAGVPPKPFLKVPFPTGAFWTNLVLLPAPKPSKQKHSSARQLPTNKNLFSYPIVAYPYAYQWSAMGKLQASYSASRRAIKANSIQDAFAPDITLGSVEDINSRQVVKFDSLSVTLRFTSHGSGGSRSNANTNDAAGNWETYIVQGSPYITAKYSGLTPELTALSDFHDIACPPAFSQADSSTSTSQPKAEEASKEQEQQQQHRRMTLSSPSTAPAVIAGAATTSGKKLGICTISSESSKQKKIVTGVQFLVTTKEQLTWLVFASEPISLEFIQGARHTIKSVEPYGGVIRLALVPPSSTTAKPDSGSGGTTATKSLDIDQLASSTGVKRLVYYAASYPVGGSVSWDFRSGTRNPLATSTTSSGSSGKSHRRLTEHVRKQHQHRRTAEAPKENNIGRITFSFDAIDMISSSSNTNVPLLMLSLPHHAASISSAENLLLSQDNFDLVYQSIKGQMVPVVGNSWSYEEELTFMGFGDESLPAKTNIAQSSSAASGTTATSQRPIVHESTAISTLDQSVRDLILATVESDLKLFLPDINLGAYGFGKQIARVAQLAHIAEVVDTANVKELDAIVEQIKNPNNGTRRNLAKVLTDTTKSPSSTVGSGTARRAYALLEKYLTIWLVSGGMAYDAQLGGVLSKEGMEDINADFGNARFNDHHFHYGYVLYASAVLGRANPKFISQYGPFVDALFYDVAHNSALAKPNDDKGIFFPLARHKSWFDGHSFASGLFPFANGKSQESSSEAINCYYGAYLWSRVRWGNNGDRKMVDFARLLLATEMTGAKTYWHMTPPPHTTSKSSGANSTSTASLGSTSLIPVTYNPAFRENYMVGNLGMTDVTCTTWFGNENIYVHLINFMPVTAITAELFGKGK